MEIEDRLQAVLLDIAEQGVKQLINDSRGTPAVTINCQVSTIAVMLAVCNAVWSISLKPSYIYPSVN